MPESPIPAPITSLLNQLSSSSVTSSLFRRRLKTYPFHKLFPLQIHFFISRLPLQTFTCTTSFVQLGIIFK